MVAFNPRISRVAMIQYHNSDKVTGMSDYMGTKHVVGVMSSESMDFVDRKFNV